LIEVRKGGKEEMRVSTQQQQRIIEKE